ncbi:MULTISPECIES: hypothetical protein [Paenibacillus]|uniref:Uncharacterized protein n=1 Tax=Paenibacillus xylanilyticus TaxID=248903 RepID=A0A7Y6BTZ1_9BACL|nr:hypothetical protein [Paenibacillus xylanilyticus]NUU74982.1 hypothetical protein [Paenibacillus xylanilyticus]
MQYVILVVVILTMSYEFRNLKEKHYIREIVYSSVLLTIGVILIVLEIANMKLPSPLMGIRILFQPVSQFFVNILS